MLLPKEKRKKITSSNGFTILEVLISMLIVALVLTIVYSAFSAGSRVCTYGSKRAQIFHSARLAMQDIIQSIENLEFGSNEYYRFIGKSDSAHVAGTSVGNDTLEIATSTKPTFINGRWHAGLAKVKYILNNDTEDGNIVLEKYVADIGEIEEDEDVDFKDAYVLELSKNICGMSFRYYDDGDYDESWDSKHKDKDNKLPEFVEITLYVKEGDTVIPFRSGALIPNMIISEKMRHSRRSKSPTQPKPIMPGGKRTPNIKPIKPMNNNRARR